MTDILSRLPRYNPRLVLLVLALALLVVNLYSWLGGRFQAMKTEIETNVVRLESYQRQKRDLPSLEARTRELKARAAVVERRLFTGAGEAEISSAMQIKLQGMVMAVGIESESIRPVAARGKAKGDDNAIIIPLVVKMRLTGTMPEFLDFLKLLYGDEKLFRIEAMTVRSYKKAGLKIFLEIRGYYQLNSGSGGLKEGGG